MESGCDAPATGPTMVTSEARTKVRPQDGVYTIDPLTDPRWSAFVERHPDASVFHTSAWLRALQTTYGYQPVAFTASAPSEPLTNALVCCEVRSWLTGNRLVSLPFSDHCEPLLEHPEQFRRIAVRAEQLAIQQGWKYLELRSANSLLDFENHFSRTTTYCLHRLDLRPSLDSLYQGFHRDCVQRKIVRAERESVRYEAGRGDSLIGQLYRLLQLTRSRHHLPPQPIEWFRNLVASMGDAVCIRIASHSGHPVAGILTLAHSKTMVYKYGGSDTRFHRLGGTAMLFWQAIQEAKQAGVEMLDFGRSDLDNSGLIAYKGRWGAERIPLYTWQSPVQVPSLHRERLKMQCAKRLFARMPASVSLFVGRLLYRHIG